MIPLDEIDPVLKILTEISKRTQENHYVNSDDFFTLVSLCYDMKGRLNLATSILLRFYLLYGETIKIPNYIADLPKQEFHLTYTLLPCEDGTDDWYIKISPNYVTEEGEIIED